ncbi:unnamed protein product [Arabidopsis thaliana]|uniref:(thale cress) hypothetical protein n=1 Tax=Arabidopsis thaliana TaxID=3702 RepID=A0A7G2EEW7_ARATH|nr:unnamed protein product [Arabidopsis thaliana]
MGYRRSYAITFVALVAALWSVTKAQPSSSCVSTLTTLSPCLSYITGNSTTPSQPCCSRLDSVIKSSPQCICSAVNSPIPNIGLNINRTQALQLPNACNIQTPPLTQCNAATGPTAQPPAPSPTEKTPDVTLTPTSLPGARSGVGGGSKTVPSVGTGSSSRNVDPLPLHFLMFAVLVYILTEASQGLVKASRGECEEEKSGGKLIVRRCCGKAKVFKSKEAVDDNVLDLAQRHAEYTIAVCKTKRLGGGFKTRSAFIAAAASGPCYLLNQLVKLTLDRDVDMMITCHPHSFVGDELSTAKIPSHINLTLFCTLHGVVPNASPTAASASSDMYGAAVLDAVEQIIAKLEPVASKHNFNSIR